jgi:hypothetical protein
MKLCTVSLVPACLSSSVSSASLSANLPVCLWLPQPPSHSMSPIWSRDFPSNWPGHGGIPWESMAMQHPKDKSHRWRAHRYYDRKYCVSLIKGTESPIFVKYFSHKNSFSVPEFHHFERCKVSKASVNKTPPENCVMLSFCYGCRDF